MSAISFDTDVSTIGGVLEARPTPPPEHPLAGASAIEVARGFGVTYGPALLLDLVVGLSAASLARDVFRRRSRGALARLLRPVAGATVTLAALYLLVLRSRMRRWGATDEEVLRALPGDELVPDPAIDMTWAVTIEAPPEEVWGWLAQIGQDRGGFYSYAGLENMAGCRLHNADRVHPEWQRRAVGDPVYLHPRISLPLARFEPGHALVLDGWGAFVVEPAEPGRTRLISRSRVPRGWQALTYPLTLEIPHFVMQRRMLLGIKARAERAAGTDGAAPVRDRGDVAHLRASLERPDGGALERFSPDMVADLPEPARRYFLHAIRVGTPLARAARIVMTGEMRLGYDQRWLPMQAHQVLAPPRGFVWEATVGGGLRRFAGADSYANGQGRTVFHLWDVLPIVRAGGADVSRSARGRLAIEAVWCPAALLPQRGVTWTPVDDRTARASLTIDGEPIALTLIVEPDGRLRTATIERWGNLTPDEQYTWIPFGVTVLDECSADGYTVPGRVEVGWWFGTDQQIDFFRATVTRLAFLA